MQRAIVVSRERYMVRIVVNGAILEEFYYTFTTYKGWPDYTRIERYIKRKYSPRTILPLVNQLSKLITFELYY